MSDINSLFIEAARKKVRFGTTRGQLSVEDLWDLSLDTLDTIAIQLSELVAKAARKSFITDAPKADADLTLQFDLVKHVIDVRLAENKAAKIAADQRAQVEFLKGLLQRKQLAELESMTPEAIKLKLAELGVVT